jgi:hypothetical protein
LAGHLDQDPDAGQDVDGGEDLQHLVGEHEIGVSDAGRGQRGDREVEPVAETPALAKRVGNRPREDEDDRGSDDRDELSSLAACLIAPTKRRNIVAREPTGHGSHRPRTEV